MAATATRIDRKAIAISLAQRHFLDGLAFEYYRLGGKLPDDEAIEGFAKRAAEAYKVHVEDILRS